MVFSVVQKPNIRKFLHELCSSYYLEHRHWLKFLESPLREKGDGRTDGKLEKDKH
jgi:hypothetical protein